MVFRRLASARRHIALGLIVVPMVAGLFWLHVQRRQMAAQAAQAALNLGLAEVDGNVEIITALCQLQQENTRASLLVARQVLRGAGAVELRPEKVSWQAIDQFSRKGQDIPLPAMAIGGRPVEINFDPAKHSPVVDETRRITGYFCTIFQRMNQQGDMLRVCTNVPDGARRAVGTYIPAAGGDGKGNPVVAAVMKGNTWAGRAFVVNEWHLASYEPIRDARGEIIGMLFVGLPERSLSWLWSQIGRPRSEKRNASFILDISGNLLGGKEGTYLGLPITEVADPEDRAAMKGMTALAASLPPGQSASYEYACLDKDTSEQCRKVCRVSRLKDWDWAVVVEADSDDLYAPHERVLALNAGSSIALAVVAGMSLVAAIWIWRLGSRVAGKNLSSVIEAIPDSFMVVDHEYRVVLANKAARDLCGLDPAAAGMRCHQVSHHSDTPCTGQDDPCPVRAVFETGKPVNVTHVHRNAAGASIHVDVTASPILDDRGRVRYAIEVCRDVTDRRQADQAIRRESAKLAAMISGMAEGVVFADAQSVIVEANDYLCRLAGKGRGELVGRTLEELHEPVLMSRIAALIEEFRMNPGSPARVIQRPLAGREVIFRVQPIYRDGAYDGVLLNVIDVTELVAARRMAERANVAKSEFLANMSHEIRTPLTAILGYSELLMEEHLPSSDRLEHTRVILRNGGHLLELINDILDISKMEADMLVLERRPCRIHAIVADVVSMMRVRAIEKHLSLTARYATPMPRTIFKDEARLRQALINLVGNAIKFTQAGEVSISVSLVPGQQDTAPVIRIAVQDTGIGMSAEVMGKLFHPFVQADSSTTRKYGGTGLGLTITKRIIEKMGGEILVESTPGQGSTFTMIVPTGSLDGIDMVEQTAEAMAETADTPPPSERTLPLGGLRILLAEDGPDNQVLIRTVLTKAGAEVDVVENGLLAVQAATQRSYDMVLMDMQMPEMDGYQAATRLRAQGYGVPIVALTAHALSSDRERCLEAGCTDYLTKPVDRCLLIERVLAWSKPASESPAAGACDPPTPVEGSGAILRSQLADAPDLADILGGFLAGLDAKVRAMQEALANNAFDELRRLAHQLKGAGGGYGYPSITEAARSLETAAKGGDAEAGALALAGLADLCGVACAGAGQAQTKGI